MAIQIHKEILFQKNINKILSVGLFASILAVNYISPAVANRFPPACYFIQKNSDKYPFDAITDCRDEGQVARYLAYNNYGIKEEDFNDFVNNVLKDKIKTL
ncbi:hypothetical protein PIROE2DRAFT_7941 [Piromyces sp. E2]|nr:hypothetical protein PIROE2DRAFT_7941 [Piromyces sp. E2]|eukprot:OUM65134.1 hypothetical protein PIROE2DRAFT_7941 [Piromyces sp. E2]